MKLCINGKEEELSSEISLDSLVEDKGFKREMIVIERNQKIIPKENWGDIFLAVISNYWFHWGDISFSNHLIIVVLVFGFMGVIEAIEKLGKKK